MDTLQPDRAAIEAQIRAAFAGVKLGKGISLRQAQAIDHPDEDITDSEFEAVPGAEITDSLVGRAFQRARTRLHRAP